MAVPERREDLLQRLFEAGRITDEERELLTDRSRLQASTALAYAAGAILVVLGAGLVGALLGATTTAWIRVAVVSSLAAALTTASWLLRRRRVLAAALALYIGAIAVWAAVVQISHGALEPHATWAQAAESCAFLVVAAAFWRVGRAALGGLAVVGGLSFLSRQISGQLLPHSPLGASGLSIVVAATTLILGTVYLRSHPLPRPLDRGSVWWAAADR